MRIRQRILQAKSGVNLCRKYFCTITYARDMGSARAHKSVYNQSIDRHIT